jgi:hypothetical protein
MLSCFCIKSVASPLTSVEPINSNTRKPKKPEDLNPEKLYEEDPEPTPNLTPNEIAKIKVNLSTLMDMNEKVYGETTAIIPEVWGMLKGVQEKNNAPDSGKDSYKTILVSALAIAGIVTEQPEIEIAAVIVGGVFEYLSTGSNSKDSTNVNFDTDFGLLSSRNTSAYNALNIMIGKMFDDPNQYRDKQWIIYNPTRWYTLRDLINIVIPNKDTELFQLAVQAQGRQYRNQITIPEMVKMQFWDVYFVQDASYSGSNFGECYVPGPPGQPNPPGGIERNRNNNKSDIGNGVRIFANDEILHFHGDYVHAQAYGTDDNDLKTSYLKAVSSFIRQFPAAYIYPYSITDSTVKSWRFYIMEGYDKIPSPSQNFGVANGDFMKWLFIDDGAGNIVNPDGVGYRYDIICANNIMRNEHMIPYTTDYDIKENLILNSCDLAFPGKPNNEKYKNILKVNVSDLINKAKKSQVLPKIKKVY